MTRIGVMEVWYGVHRAEDKLHIGGSRLNRTFFDTKTQLMASLRSLYGMQTNADVLKEWKPEYQEIII